MTRKVLLANNAVSTLASSITSTSTSLSVQAGDGAKFPSLTTGQFFFATLVKSTGQTEVVKVTAKSTDTFTVVRAAEPVGGSSVSYAYSIGDRIEHRLTSGALAGELDRLDQASYINPLNKSANYTITESDITSLVRVSTASGNITITLPDISTLTQDFDVIVAKTTADYNTVTVTRAGSDTINGATTYTLTSQWQGAWLTADRSTGTWTVIASGGGGVKANVDTFTGSGSAGPFTLSGDPGIKENTAVYVGGVYQQKSTYTLVGTSLTLGGTVGTGVPIEVIWAQPLPVGITTANQTTASDGASGTLFTTVAGFISRVMSNAGSALVGFIQAGTGAVQRTAQDKLRDMVGIKDFGVNRAAFMAAYTAFNDVRLPAGEYVIDTAKIGELQKPLTVIGEGTDTVLRIGPSNVDKTAFRVGAVGGLYYETRAVTKFENLTFKTPSGITAPWAYTGIDVQSTHPIVLKDIVMLSMGPDAVKMQAIYYGYVQGLYLVNSGLTLNDVNNIEFSGGDIRPDEYADTSHGAVLFGNVGKYPVQMTESDLIKFTDTTIEGWACPAVRLVRCYTTIFNGSWFEGNNSSSHIIKMEQAQTVEFNSCQLDFAIPYTDCFIKVDNSIPNADENQHWRPFIRISGGYLLLMSTPYGDAPKFLKTTNSEKCTVLIEGTTLRGGNLYADRSVEFDVRSLLLNGAFKHNFYSKPNVDLLPKFNRWMPDSVSANWDFASGANFTATAGLTVATTTTVGEYMTGTRGVKVSGIPSDNSAKLIQRTTTGEMNQVTSQEQTYLVFVRVKCDQNVTFKATINGGYADFGQTPDTDLPANTWRDYVFKTQEDVTWAQGRFFTPSIYLYVTNNSGSAATLYIDRIDYQIVTGDFQI